MSLEQLTLSGVGPCESLEMDCAPRLNVLTGDNGLGKSFLLDVIWWSLAGHWPDDVMLARQANATISYSCGRPNTPRRREEVHYDARMQRWDRKLKQDTEHEHVEIYGRVDGSFLIADTTQLSYLPSLHERRDEKTEPVKLSQREVWEGLKQGNVSVCSGLIHDWALWQARGDVAFKQLSEAIKGLFPAAEAWEPAEGKKVRVGDDRDFPTLRSPYGELLPIIHLSAGMRRVLSMAYMLVWAWSRHKRDAALQGVEPAKSIVFLLDEIDAHLHPSWQRKILPSLLRVIEEVTGAQVQLFVVTHAPLVLASLEPHFTEQDKLWTFDLVREEDGARVVFSQVPWTRRGDANSWLTSEVFDLKQARSLEAEQALEAARRLLIERAPSEEALEEVTRALARSLSPIDSFWLRWSTYLEGRGITL